MAALASPVGHLSEQPQPLEIAKYIVYESNRIDYEDPLLALSIALSESGLNPLARNRFSTAKGVFQFLDGTWKAAQCHNSPLNATANIQCGLRLLKDEGYYHWTASQWGKGGWYELYVKSVLAYSRLRLAALGM